MIKEYSSQQLKKIEQLAHPRVLLNVCTHGTERVGIKIANHFSKIKIEKGALTINVANKKALRAKKRFISSDLNRVFPGKKNGDYEERLAYKMTPFVKLFDFVIDVHSTESGMKSTVIIVKPAKKLTPILTAIHPPKIVYMSATKSNAFISQAKLGIGFEYGKDKDIKTYTNTVVGIYRVLEYFKMIEPNKKHVVSEKKPILYFNAYKTFPKPEGFIVNKKIRNFVLVPSGTIIGQHPVTKKVIRSKKSFYPILFGKNTYKNIFGFVAKKFKGGTT